MAWLLVLASLATQQAPQPDLLLYRFWRPPNVLSVSGVVTMPLADLVFTPDPAGREQAATYGVQVEFRDSAGTVLRSESWSRRVTLPPGAVSPAAQAVETLAFDLAPGRYTLRIAVTDSATGATSTLERPVEASGDRPATADLVLASDLRRMAEGEEPPQGTFVRNGIVITPNLAGVVAGEQPSLGLFTEVYPPAGAALDTAVVSLVLRRRDAEAVQERPVARRIYQEAGGVETMHVPLDGLLPGEYVIGFKIAFPDTTITVERAFLVRGATRQLAAGLFAGLDALALDSIFEVSRYIADASERELYEGLDAGAKRRFLERFWALRDPTPATPNEAYVEYMERVAFANREFAERRRAQPGWKTERGRIYIMHGPPAERYTSREVGQGVSERPFEIWKYAGGRNDKYVFYDEFGNDVFHLLYSTDPREIGLPEFERRFPGLADLVRRM